MKKLILIIVFIGFNHQLFADSPLTSIEISRAYSHEPIVIIASKANGELTLELMQDLKKIAFVKKAISYKARQIVVVNEKEKHYELGYETSGEKVDKETGKVFDFWDRIYAPEEDPLVEMLANPCPTQKELKKGFEHLKEIILKKGRKKRVKGDNYPNYIYKNFMYRNLSEKNFPMEVIYVENRAENTFYQIIKSDGSYQIDIKDYQQIIALQKHKAAQAHFCTHILKF